MLINPEEINNILKLAETRAINKGKKYYEQNRVLILESNIKNEKEFSYETAVSDTDALNYIVNVDIQDGKINSKCDCKEHLNSGALCSHIIASLFDAYIEPDKYKNFKNTTKFKSSEKSNEKLKIKKYAPIDLNKQQICNSIQKILNLDEDVLLLLYKLIMDLFNKGKYEIIVSSLKNYISFDKNLKIKVLDVIKEDPKYKINVSKSDFGYDINIDLKEEKFFIDNNNLYYIKNDEIFECSKEFTINILPILVYLLYKKDNVISIDSKNINQYYKYVLSYIDKITKITFDKEILEEYNKYKLSVDIFLDVDEQSNIIADIKYKYGENELEMFSNEHSNLRNALEEKSIEKILYELGFTVDYNLKKIYMSNDDAKFNFLNEGINILNSKYNVYIANNLKNKKVINPQKLDLNIRLISDLIEVDFNEFDISAKELKKILESYKMKKKYYKLENGDYLNIENKIISKFVSNIKDIVDFKEDKIKISKNRALYLNSILLNDTDYNIKTCKEFNKILSKIEEFKVNEYDLPEELNAKLRNYQVSGYNWMMSLKENNFNGVLADDMGLGKTLQVIAVLQNAKNNKEKTSIVVCPSSLYLNWQKEIEKFSSNLTSLTIYGNAKKRNELIKQISNYDVIITSYDILKRDIEKYLKYEFNYIIADEAQYIKNNNTQNAKAIKLLKSKNKLALTGTPMENSLSELWSIFDFIMPGYLFSYTKFKEKFEKPIMLDGNNHKSEILNNMISPFLLRRIKSEVLKDLPTKNETIIYNVMNNEQQKVYDSYLLEAKKEIREELANLGVAKSQMKILSIITRLRQICCHPKLFINNYDGKSAKLEQCIELIKDMIESNHKILLFSGFTSMFEIIEKELNNNSIKFFKLDGKTKTDVRMELVDKFNSDTDTKVFLVSLKAGGVGLNLIGADIVMHFDPWWNLSLENQATDRTYRIGQKKNVQVFKYITENSIEEKIQKMQINKKNIVDLIIKDGENFINKLNIDEILNLISKD